MLGKGNTSLFIAITAVGRCEWPIGFARMAFQMRLAWRVGSIYGVWRLIPGSHNISGLVIDGFA